MSQAAAADLIDRLAGAGYRMPFQKLRSLQVEVSSACNLRCPQCFSHISGHVTALMKKELWDERLKPHLKQFSDVYLVGIGEPLLNRHFFDFVSDSREAGARVHTTSNLQLSTPGLPEHLVTSGLNELSFSCDGATPETYAAIRKRGRLDRLEAALAAIGEARQRHGSRTPLLCLNFGATVANIRELPEVLLLAKRHQVQTVIAYHNVAYVETEKDQSLYHQQALSDRLFTEAAAFCREARITFLYPGLFSRPLRRAPQEIYCAYPFQHLYIYSDGRVGPCCMDFPDRYQLGDLRRSSLPEVWNEAAVRDLRKELCGSPSYTCRFCVSHLKMDISDPRYFFRFPGAEAYLDGLAR